MTFKSFSKPRWSLFLGIFTAFVPAQGLNATIVVDLEFGAPLQTLKTAVNPENGHTYHLITGGVTQANPLGGLSWTEANSFAGSFSGNGYSSSLVSINSASEQEWIGQHFMPSGSDQSNMNQVIWIGLSDHHSEGSFVWENGDPVHHTNWAENLPNDPNGSEDFVYLTNTNRFDPFVPLGTWNDYKNEPTFFGALPFSAIVEVVPIPEPSSVLLVLLSTLTCLRRRR